MMFKSKSEKKYGQFIHFNTHLTMPYKTKALKNVLNMGKMFSAIAVLIKGVINLTQSEFHTFHFITF